MGHDDYLVARGCQDFGRVIQPLVRHMYQGLKRGMVCIEGYYFNHLYLISVYNERDINFDGFAAVYFALGFKKETP